jgi:hypothetical protein
MPRTARRAGYTFIELVVTMASSAILMAGLASVLFIASKAITPDATATQDANRSSLALAQLTADLRLALDLSERTATAVTFTVPDRNGDGAVETLRYSWGGTAGNPLQYRYNSDTAVTLLANVQTFNLSALTRTIAADALGPAPTAVAFQSFAETKAAVDVATLAIMKASGVNAGDLLIATLATDGNVIATVSAPSGWTLVSRLTSGSAVGVGVWWKIASASEPGTYAFSWTGNERAYGWTMRFTGANTTSPINAFTTNVGTSSTPTCSATTTSVANTMVLRIGGFDAGDISTDNPGLSAHTAITMDRSDSGGTSASGGAGYRRVGAVGSTGASNFALTNSQEFVTFTIAIAPQP